MNLEEIAAELYGLQPERFTEARNARAAEVTTTGDRELARDVRKLPKPTVAAWLANLLVRQHSSEVAELIALGVQVREAHRRGARHDMRKVADRRRRLIGRLVESASTAATEAGHSVGLQVQRLLEETLEAAVVDEEAAASLQEGRLSAPLQFIGFGGLLSTESGIKGISTRKQVVRSKPSTSEREAASDERRAAQRALAEADRAQATAQAALDSAVASVEEARELYDAASARLRAAAKEVKDAERDRARTAELLQKARQFRSDSERRLKAADRERKGRLADLESTSK